MKTLSHFTIFHLLKIFAAGAVLTSLTACATGSGLFRQADSPLLIQTFDSPGSEIVHARAFETSDRLYVTGVLPDRTGLPAATHVDVQLVDANERVIVEKQSDLATPNRHPQTAGHRFRHPAYVESFPLFQARQAEKIFVRFHRVSHGV